MNGSSNPTSKAVQSAIELVQTFADTNILKSEFGRLSKVDVESYQDENGYDMLHHAIIANNIEAVTLLFFKGHFLPPHEYRSLSYMHLAARLGHRTILGLLLQDRPHDNKVVVFNYQTSNHKHLTTPKDTEQTECTPLDIAGKSGHIGCVKLILDHFLGLQHGRGRFTGKDAHINMACQLDSPNALRLLLSQSATDEELKSAVGAALKLARPECLDILLRLHPDLSSLFGGMNLYHVLYSYSLSFDKKWIEALPAVTAVLLRHGHSVISSVPFRTYPLYSLICLYIKCQDMEDKLPYITACLVLLLNGGADPNFNEVEFETYVESLNIQPAFGRLAYSSALHCLFGNVSCLSLHFETFSVKDCSDMLQQITDLLLRHKANPNVIGRVSEDNSLMGTAFHAFFDMSIAIGLERKTLSLLLKYGADPNIEWNGVYPLNLIIEHFVSESDISKHLTKNDLNIFLELVNQMSYKAIRHLIDKTCTYNEDLTSEQEEYKRIIIEKMKDVLAQWSLKKMCQQCILKSCDRNKSKILKLPFPMRLKHEILEFIIDV